MFLRSNLLALALLLPIQSFGLCTIFSDVPLRPKPNLKVEGLKVSKFTPLKWTGTKDGKFLEVEDFKGKKFWVRKREVSEDVTCLAVTAKKAKLRSGPGVNFEALPTLAKQGDAFLDLGGEDGWTQIQMESGERAWINMDNTWKPFGKTMRMSFEKDL